MFWEKYRPSAGDRSRASMTRGSSLTPMRVDHYTTDATRFDRQRSTYIHAISELGHAIFVTAYSLCTEITRSRFPSRSFDRPSSHRLDLGLRIIKGKSLVFRLVYNVQRLLGVTGQRPRRNNWREWFSSNADSKYKLKLTLFWEKYRASTGDRSRAIHDEMAHR